MNLSKTNKCGQSGKKSVGVILALVMVWTQAVPAGWAGALTLPDDSYTNSENEMAAVNPPAEAQAGPQAVQLSLHDMFFMSNDKPLSPAASEDKQSPQAQSSGSATGEPKDKGSEESPFGSNEADETGAVPAEENKPETVTEDSERASDVVIFDPEVVYDHLSEMTGLSRDELSHYIESVDQDLRGLITVTFKEGMMSEHRLIGVLDGSKLPATAVFRLEIPQTSDISVSDRLVLSATLTWPETGGANLVANISYENGQIETVNWIREIPGTPPCRDGEMCLAYERPSMVALLYQDTYSYAYDGDGVKIERRPWLITEAVPMVSQKDSTGSFPLSWPQPGKVLPSVMTLQKMADGKHHIVHLEEQGDSGRVVTTFEYIEIAAAEGLCEGLPCDGSVVVIELAGMVRIDKDGNELSRTTIDGNTAYVVTAGGNETQVTYKTLGELVAKIRDLEKISKEAIRIRNIVRNDLIQNFALNPAELDRWLREKKVEIRVDLKSLKVEVLFHVKPNDSGVNGSAALVDPLGNVPFTELITYQLGKGPIPMIGCLSLSGGEDNCPVFVPKHFLVSAEFRSGEFRYRLNYQREANTENMIWIPLGGDNRLHGVVIDKPFVCDAKDGVCPDLESTLIKDITYNYSGDNGAVTATVKYGAIDHEGVASREVRMDKKNADRYIIREVKERNYAGDVLVVNVYHYASAVEKRPEFFIEPGKLLMITRTTGAGVPLSVIRLKGAGEAVISVKGVDHTVTFRSLEELLNLARDFEDDKNEGPGVVYRMAFGDGEVIVEESEGEDGSVLLTAKIMNREGRTLESFAISSYEELMLRKPNFAAGLRVQTLDGKTIVFESYRTAVRITAQYTVTENVASELYAEGLRKTTVVKFEKGRLLKVSEVINYGGPRTSQTPRAAYLQISSWSYDSQGNLKQESITRRTDNGSMVNFRRVIAKNGTEKATLRVYDAGKVLYYGAVDADPIRREASSGLMTGMSGSTFRPRGMFVLVLHRAALNWKIYEFTELLR